jgi:hypothetical protein
MLDDVQRKTDSPIKVHSNYLYRDKKGCYVWSMTHAMRIHSNVKELRNPEGSRIMEKAKKCPSPSIRLQRGMDM